VIVEWWREEASKEVAESGASRSQSTTRAL
jgi:hypothetical protein